MYHSRTMKYFAEHNGEVVELSGVYHDFSIYTSAKHFTGKTPDGTLLQASHKAYYKNHPSLHKCDGRCMHAKGHNCECACGGKNHGRGN